MTSYHFSNEYGILHIVMENGNFPYEIIISVAIVTTIIAGWMIWKLGRPEKRLI